MIRIFFFTLAWFYLTSGFAQLVADRQYYSRMIVPRGLTCRIEAQNLTIDTLIMDNHSTLEFTLHSTKLKVRNALIGKKCLFNAAGVRTGVPGRDLILEINFKKLGRLTIDTRGGAGYTGQTGRTGVPGIDGSIGLADGGPGGQGGNGGPGGNGGNLALYYDRNGLTPQLRKSNRNSLILKYAGGPGGRGGQGGPGGRGGRPKESRYEVDKPIREVNGIMGATGPTGIRGFWGKNGKDGVLIFEPIH